MKVLIGIGLLLAMMTLQSCSSAKTGPNGGDVVTLNNGQAKAEVVANADTGEVMAPTWDQNLKNSQLIENKPLMIGSGDHTLALQPHPASAAGFTGKRSGCVEAECITAGWAARTKADTRSPGTTVGGGRPNPRSNVERNG